MAHEVETAAVMTRGVVRALGSLVALGAFGLLVMACSGSDQDPVLVSTTVGCELIIDAVDDLPDGYRDLAASAALPVLENGMQVGRRDNGYRFSKFGMAVAAGVQTSVTIDPAQGDAYLDHGVLSGPTPPDQEQQITFEACASSAGQWVVYAGGIWTTQDGCVDVTVSSARATETTTIGIRVPC